MIELAPLIMGIVLVVYADIIHQRECQSLKQIIEQLRKDNIQLNTLFINVINANKFSTPITMPQHKPEQEERVEDSMPFMDDEAMAVREELLRAGH